MKLFKHFFLFLFLFTFAYFFCVTAAADVINTNQISFTYDERGIFRVASPKDPYNAQVTSAQRPLSLVVRYRVEQDQWQSINFRQSSMVVSEEDGLIQYTFSNPESPLRVVQIFKTNDAGFDWDIELETTSDKSVTIGDLAIDIPINGPRGQNPQQIFEQGFMQHQFISGYGSFI